MASTHDYRVVSAEASAVAPDHGGSCMVKLHLKSWASLASSKAPTRAEEKVKPPVRVAVLPHLSLTDVLYGARSRWCLVCTKRPGQTQWATMPDDNHGSGNMDGGGFSSTSASSTWEWSSSTGLAAVVRELEVVIIGRVRVEMTTRTQAASKIEALFRYILSQFE